MRTFPLKGRKTTILDRNQSEKKQADLKSGLWTITGLRINKTRSNWLVQFPVNFKNVQSFLKPFGANLDQFAKLLEISEVFICEVFVLDKWVIRSFNLSNSYLRKFFILLQPTLAISNMRYLEFRVISNFFPSPFSIYGLLPYKMSRYLELRCLELFAISN